MTTKSGARVDWVLTQARTDSMSTTSSSSPWTDQPWTARMRQVGEPEPGHRRSDGDQLAQLKVLRRAQGDVGAE